MPSLTIYSVVEDQKRYSRVFAKINDSKAEALETVSLDRKSDLKETKPF